MLKKLFLYFDFAYYLRFALLFLLFYLSYTFVIAVSVPSGTYYPFVEKYLNFPAVIRDSILAVSKLMLSILGYQTVLLTDTIASADGRVQLFMAFPCYGLGLKSFWVAFVCAHKIKLKSKINWSALGIIVIFFLNCMRVTVIMIAMWDGWTIANSLNWNAHEFFNYLCYAALLGLVLLFYKKAYRSVKSIGVISENNEVARS